MGKQGLTLHFTTCGLLIEVCAHFIGLRRTADLLPGYTYFCIYKHEVNQHFWQRYYLSLL